MKKSLRTIIKIYADHPRVFLLLAALALNVVIESLSRRNLLGGFFFIFQHPLMFLYNALIIYTTLSLCLVFKKRVFFLSLLSILWLSCGIANFIILGFRTMPFSAVDLQIFSSVFTIMFVYLEPWQVASIALLVAATVVSLVVLWVKSPKFKGRITYLKTSVAIASTFLLIAIVQNSTNAAATSQGNFPNITDAYRERGFAYCFSNSIIDQGIDRPEDYDMSYMESFRREMDRARVGTQPAVTPNILMVQLESFFDANLLKDMQFNENPVPNFTELKERYGGGFLSVPSVGAGTANTEFEVLTGVSLDFFGASEYPYRSELMKKSLESVCYNLQPYGYKSHAIHNNDGSFYDRNKVFPNLGFDYFTSIEYMEDVEENPMGWAKDGVLVKEVADLLTHTASRDFVYAISVQAHGKYPADVLEGAPNNISITSSDQEMTEDSIHGFEYFLNQICEVDLCIKEMTDYFSNYYEPTLIVFYGDHLPSLGLEADDLENGDLLQTEYVVWNNFGLPVVKKDLEAFQLSSHLFNLLDFNGGYVSTYNQFFSEDADYPFGLQYLGYDMLYGDSEALYHPSDMKMGIRDVTITNVAASPDNKNELMILGERFTPYSTVMVDGKRLDATFLDSKRLVVHEADRLRKGDLITVAQIGTDSEVLSETKPWQY